MQSITRQGRQHFGRREEKKSPHGERKRGGTKRGTGQAHAARCVMTGSDCCRTTGPCRRRWRGRRSTRGAADGGGVGGSDEVGHGRSGDGGPAGERRCEPAKGRAWHRCPPRGPSGRGRRARQATTDRAPRGGCSALRAERSLPPVCNDRFGGLYMHGGNYQHWLVTARVKSLSANWARATVSALLGRRATTVGGTVVAGN